MTLDTDTKTLLIGCTVAVGWIGVVALLAVLFADPPDCQDPHPTGLTRNHLVSAKPMMWRLQAEVVCKDGIKQWLKLG